MKPTPPVLDFQTQYLEDVAGLVGWFKRHHRGNVRGVMRRDVPQRYQWLVGRLCKQGLLIRHAARPTVQPSRNCRLRLNYQKAHEEFFL